MDKLVFINGIRRQLKYSLSTGRFIQRASLSSSGEREEEVKRLKFIKEKERIRDEMEFAEILSNIRLDMKQSMMKEIAKLNMEAHQLRIVSRGPEQEYYYDSEHIVDTPLNTEEDLEGLERLVEEDKEVEKVFRMRRGEEGVWDVWELVLHLREEGCEDVCAISIPPHLQYTDYLILATARSSRHLRALILELNKLYKARKLDSDPFLYGGKGRAGLRGPVRQGFKGKPVNSPWQSLDLGHIVLHLFVSDEMRRYYDIEGLWSMGDGWRDDAVSDQPSIIHEHNKLLAQYEDAISPNLRARLGM